MHYKLSVIICESISRFPSSRFFLQVLAVRFSISLRNFPKEMGYIFNLIIKLVSYPVFLNIFSMNKDEHQNIDCFNERKQKANTIFEQYIKEQKDFSLLKKAFNPEICHELIKSLSNDKMMLIVNILLFLNMFFFINSQDYN